MTVLPIHKRLQGHCHTGFNDASHKTLNLITVTIEQSLSKLFSASTHYIAFNISAKSKGKKGKGQPMEVKLLMKLRPFGSYQQTKIKKTANHLDSMIRRDVYNIDKITSIQGRETMTMMQLGVYFL